MALHDGDRRYRLGIERTLMFAFYARFETPRLPRTCFSESKTAKLRLVVLGCSPPLPRSSPRRDAFAGVRGAGQVPLSAMPAPRVGPWSTRSAVSGVSLPALPPEPFQEALEVENVFIGTLGPELRVPSCRLRHRWWQNEAGTLHRSRTRRRDAQGVAVSFPLTHSRSNTCRFHGRICSRKRPKAQLYEVSASTCLLKELPKKGKQAPGAPAAPRHSVEEKLTCDCLSCEPGESSLPLWSPLTVFFPPKEQLTHPGYSDTGTREIFLKSEQSEPGTVREATGSVGCQS